MESKGFYLFMVVAVVVCVHSTYGLPRDSSVIKTEEVAPYHDGSVAEKIKPPVPPVVVEISSESPTTTTPTPTHGRVKECEFEEATETEECQGLCIPKGYSYGLCIGHKCSCI